MEWGAGPQNHTCRWSPGNLALEMEWAQVAARRGGVRLRRTSRLRVIRYGPGRPGVESPFQQMVSTGRNPTLASMGCPLPWRPGRPGTAGRQQPSFRSFQSQEQSGHRKRQWPPSVHTARYIHCTHSPYAACTPQQGAPPPLCRL